MQFFYNFSDALFAFMQRGGDVLFNRTSCICYVVPHIRENVVLFYTHKTCVDQSMTEWDQRQDKSSWNSKAIRNTDL